MPGDQLCLRYNTQDKAKCLAQLTSREAGSFCYSYTVLVPAHVCVACIYACICPHTWAHATEDRHKCHNISRPRLWSGVFPSHFLPCVLRQISPISTTPASHLAPGSSVSAPQVLPSHRPLQLPGHCVRAGDPKR